MSGQDPLANMQNLIGYQGLVGPNPYLQYQGQIPMAGYMGWPTNAQGLPIQPSPGMNLNTTPQQAFGQPTLGSTPSSGPGTPPITGALASPAAMGGGGRPTPMPGTAQAWYAQANPAQRAQMDAMGQTAASGNWGIQGSGGFGGGVNNQAGLGQAAALAPILQRQYQAQQPAQQQGNVGANPQTGLTRDQYLQLLAHPGYVQTPGAAGPQPGQMATGASSQPSVLGAFLGGHPGAQTTPLANAGFFKTLQQLQGGA